MKLKIKIITIGNMPFEFNSNKIRNWNSNIFEVVDNIQNYSLNSDSDCENWVYSDNNLEKEIIEEYDADFLIAILNIPLELNWYSRRLSKNRVIFSYHNLKEIFLENNIPFENVILRLLYGYSIIYKSYNNTIPLANQKTDFTHDEARGCLFDMNGIIKDIIYSCNKPILCSQCYEKFSRMRVSTDLLKTAQNEIKNIKKYFYFEIVDFIKRHPIISLIISSIYAVFIGALGSYLSKFIP